MHKKKKIVITASHTAKDSVFTNLFKDLKYLLQMYQALHPDDDTVTEKDLKIITLEKLLLNQMYNDLGFLVRGCLILLVECQSIWSVNIALRLFLYLAQTYKEYIQENNLNVHSRTKIVLPKPELYVIYTGEPFENMPEEISLADEFFGGDKSVVDIKVKVIYDGEKGDIINQYCNFTRIYREQSRIYGWTQKAVWETIRICEEQDILREYLQGREKEVVDIMMTLFDQKTAMNAWEHEIRQEAEQKIREADQKARESDRKARESDQKARESDRKARESDRKARESDRKARESDRKAKEANQKAEAISKKSSYELYKNGIPMERISVLLGIPIKTLQQWFQEPVN